jgi:Arc/MetJ-type ribon-helix-helix transcriptional regulator
MKLSVSLPDDDVAFLDQVALDRALDSRSAALQAAVKALREQSLVEAYMEEFLASRGEYAEWDATSGDGIAE